MSVRLLVVVEGDTEEGFVNRVLGPHLWDFNVFSEAKRVATKYRRGHALAKGGGRHYRNWKNDLRLLRSKDDNPDRWLTTMIDLYGLAKFKDQFPGYTENRSITDPYKRVEAIEEAFQRDLEAPRFVPYIQLYEFEALILTDPRMLGSEYLEHGRQIRRLERMARSFESPELIDEGDETAPSKRIAREIPEYEYNKARVGVLMTEKIGLSVLRAKCRHFHAWVSRLEGIGGVV